MSHFVLIFFYEIEMGGMGTKWVINIYSKDYLMELQFNSLDFEFVDNFIEFGQIYR